VPLAANEGLACLALRLQRIDFLFEPLFGGFAGVDCAANSCVPPCAEAHWSPMELRLARKEGQLFMLPDSEQAPGR
jgi:hypothetical protein